MTFLSSSLLRTVVLFCAVFTSSVAFQPPAFQKNKVNKVFAETAPVKTTTSLEYFNGRSTWGRIDRLSAASSDTSNDQQNQLDTGAILKYGSSIVIQMTLITTLFAGLDYVASSTGIMPPFLALLPFFYAFSLKSRVFNPLNNQRPDREKAMKGGEEAASKGFRDRVMPSWTPPGVIFPIMWLLIIGPIRSYTSALVFEGNGHHFCDPAILSLMLHLSIGDVWNTINNTEKRYGASVSAISFVFASAAFAAYQYYQVDPFAGKLLGATLLWFTVASTLIFETWRLNPDADTGKRDTLYPTVGGGEVETEFMWF